MSAEQLSRDEVVGVGLPGGTGWTVSRIASAWAELPVAVTVSEIRTGLRALRS